MFFAPFLAHTILHRAGYRISQKTERCDKMHLSHFRPRGINYKYAHRETKAFFQVFFWGGRIVFKNLRSLFKWFLHPLPETSISSKMASSFLRGYLCPQQFHLWVKYQDTHLKVLLWVSNWLELSEVNEEDSVSRRTLNITSSPQSLRNFTASWWVILSISWPLTCKLKMKIIITFYTEYWCPRVKMQV